MIRYEINEKKRIVVARFEKDPLIYLQKLICHNIFKGSNSLYADWTNIQADWRNLHKLIRKEIKGDEKLLGKAKCHPDDEFDIEVGKNIAKERLLIKWHKFKYRILKLVYRKIKEESNLLLDRLECKVGIISGGTYQ